MKTSCLISTYGLLLVVALGLPVFTLAQSWSVKHYGTADGLPGNTTYQVVQDDKGYMWITTNNGICRFDGKEFKTYNSPLIKNNEILRCKMVWGQPWFLNFKGVLFYIEEEEVHRFYPEEDEEDKNILDWLEDDFGNLFVLVEQDTTQDALLVFERNVAGEVTLKKRIEFEEDSYGDSRIKNYLIKQNKQLFLIEDTKDSYVLEYQYSENLFKEVYLGKRVGYANAYQFQNKPKLLFYDKYRKKFWLNYIPQKGWGSTSLPQHPHLNTILYYFQDSQSRIWSYDNKRLLRLNDKFEIIQDLTHLVNNQRVNEIKEDREGNIWFSTNKDGLYVLQNSPFIQYTPENSDLPDKYIYDIDGDKQGNVCIASHPASLSLMRGKKIVSNTQMSDSKSEIYDIMVYDDKDILVALDGIYVYQVDNDKLIKKLEPSSRSSIKRFTQNNNKDVLLSAPSYTYYLNEHEAIHYSIPIKPYCGLLQEKNMALIGSNRGMYELVLRPSNANMELLRTPSGIYINPYLNYQGIDHYFQDRNPLIKKHYFQDSLSIDYYIADIQKAKDSTIWIATRSNGLYQIENNAIVHHYLEGATSITSNICHRVFIDEKNQAWLSTNKGLNRIHPKTHQVRRITVDDGLTSNFVTSTYKFEDQVYVGTGNGLTVFNENDITDVQPAPPVILRDIKINEKDTLLKSTYHLNWNHNALYIGFIAPYFQGKISYKYRMLGIRDDWINTDDNYARFPELTAGKYTFEVKSVTSNNIESKEVAQVKFTIKPHPLFSPLAYSLYALTLLACLLLAFYLRIRQIKYQEGEKTKINKKFAELELQALQAQMNPHFVFNAMNAIQNYIVKKEVNEANRYLAEFGRLMRLFLDSSYKKYIDIEEEIELLQLYIRLEKLRFRDKFEVHFHIDEQVEQTLEIPSLLLQPFVENAINHGLAYKEGKGELHISMKQQADTIHIAIEDNGIGRERAMKIRQGSFKSYKPLGIQIINERLATLHTMEDLEVNLTIIDLADDAGNAVGTRVEMQIPIIE